MAKAGEKIKYCSVGNLVCQIYFASSIETLKRNKDGNVNVNSLHGEKPVKEH